MELDVIVERAAVELGELFGADVALLSLGPDEALAIAGHYGVRPRDLPERTFGLPELSTGAHVRIGPADDVPVPLFLCRYGAKHVAWARLVVGEESLGHLTLVRRAEHPFERTDADELRAIAYRIALAIENGRLHRRMSDQLVRLRRLHDITTELAGTIELDTIGRRVAEVLVSEVPVRACSLAIERLGAFDTLSCAGAAGPDAEWQDIALQAAGISVGRVAVAGAPAEGTEARGRWTTSSASPRSRWRRRCSTSAAGSRRGATRSPGCSPTRRSRSASRASSPKASRSASPSSTSTTSSRSTTSTATSSATRHCAASAGRCASTRARPTTSSGSAARAIRTG